MSATVWSQANFRGQRSTLTEGRHRLAHDVTDLISSVKVAEGFEAKLYDNNDFTGTEYLVNQDTPQLPDSINNKASSIVVYKKPVAAAAEDSEVYIFSAENGDNWFYFEDNTTDD
ncbi:hypothetical protein ACFYUY_04385 [Kitasatospora sp. NPDC004745]|uniref:hypothetical protein n=1 Tax=Kitasatospora sp. NPDC004745 TaxID=3364019 RepID=UPI0036B7C4A7